LLIIFLTVYLKIYTVPPPGLTLPVAGHESPSMVIVLKVPKWKKAISRKTIKNSVDNGPGDLDHSLGILAHEEEAENSVNNGLEDSGRSLGALAHAAAIVEAASPASSGLTTPTSLPSPPANILEGSPPEYGVKAEPLMPESLAGINIVNTAYQHTSPGPVDENQDKWKAGAWN
jgi:hypothetical protein